MQGFGDRFRSRRTTLDGTPSPADYNYNTLFSPNQTTTTFANFSKGDKTKCFGAGREDFVKTVNNFDK